MREQKRMEQMNRYKKTVIRICLPNDKLVFQAVFKPTDSVEDIKRVIKQYITSDDFYLYTVPPKRVLKAESSLFDSDLVPAALIQIGFNSGDNHQNLVKEEFKSKLSSYKSAAKVAAEARSHNRTAPNASGNTTQTSTENQRRGPNSGEKDGKVPKWFKTH